MSLRMGSNQGMSRANPLDKRVPRNPRYADVESKVKTGMTVDKLTFITTRQHLQRREEPYYRLTPAQLSELLSEYEQDRQEGVQDFRDHIDPDHHGPRVVEHEPDATPTYERPYLILDVRDPEDFRRCRVTQARSFEAKLLNQDRMTPELYMYKNKEGGLVVLYSNDDREACHAATTLIHRGFDNVFVLSGGIVAFARSFHSFVEGEIAALPPIAACSGSGSTRGSTRGRRSTIGGSTHAGGGRGDGSRSDNGSRSVGGSALGSVNTNGGGKSSGSCIIVRGGGRASHGGRLAGATGIGARGPRGGVRPRGGRGASTVCSVRAAGSEPRDPAYAGRDGATACAPGRSACQGQGVLGGRGNSLGGLGEVDHGGSIGSSRGMGKRNGFFSPNGVSGGGGGGMLAKAAGAASAAHRRSVGGEGGAGDVSRGSMATVADSVISRATARRGRW